ncbi:DUF6085 family protein [Micromonospora chokoriensis]|uniref:DUF6085 family protein n=1 Tax=Micromonospora chokoriensis TaxID=356851 RepID=UPI00055CF1A5|nr:DUF6085 family protein [Micromonospora chokoriensis]
MTTNPAPPAVYLDLDAIEARVLAATPGPWRASIGTIRGVDGVHEQVVTDSSDGFDVVAMTGRMDEHPRSTLDAEFIARSRDDVPAMVAEIKRLRAALAEDEPHHIIEFLPDGWVTLQHPLACRPTLAACPVNELVMELDGSPVPPGRYECEVNDLGDRLLILDRVDVPEATDG